MTTYIYATKNKKSGDFGKVSSEIYKPEQITDLYVNSVKEAPDDKRVFLEELEVYCLGSLDTKTGVISGSPQFLIDLGSVVHGETSRKTE